MMIPCDREVHLYCSVEQKRDAWKDGAYVAELLSREVVVQVRSPSAITLTHMLGIACLCCLTPRHEHVPVPSYMINNEYPVPYNIINSCLTCQ